MDKVKKGDISKVFVTANLLSKGFTVLEPISENSRYDLVIEYKNKFKRIQVKTIYFRKKQNCFEMACYSTTRRKKKHVKTSYTKKDVDFIIGYNQEKKELYVFPIDKLKTQQVRFRKNARKNQYNPLKVGDYLNSFKLLRQ